MSTEKLCADLILDLLLGREDRAPLAMGSSVRWDVMLTVARDNRVAVRLYDRLLMLGVPPDDTYRLYVTKERERIACITSLMERIGELCELAGARFVFMKNYQHYPDMGDDIDLLVLDNNDIADSIVVEQLGGRPYKLSLRNRIGGKTQYYVDSCATYVEIHHGRMGLMGEHALFPQQVLDNRRLVSLNGIGVFVPRPEDQFIAQVLQRVYGRMALRISELVYCVAAVREDSLDWQYIGETVRRMGVSSGLRCYLNCVDQICGRVLQGTSLSESGLLDEGRDVKIRFKGLQYRAAWATVGARLYPEKFVADVLLLNWDGMARLCLIPFFGALVGIEALVRSGRRGNYDKKQCTQSIGLSAHVGCDFPRRGVNG